MTTAIANDRLLKRFEKWDSDASGTLERGDFEMEAIKVARAFGKDLASAEARALTDAFTGLFDYLAQEAGTADSISRGDFVRVNENLIFEQGEASFNRVLGPVVQAIVGLCDKNDDGQINAEEFASWLSGVGMSRAEAQDAFAKVDTNGNGELSVDELLAAVRKYHFGQLDVELLG
ncbi:EF-hand domain-containing protein [Saccharopolyspora phatthalungensis]|uniref:Ca2+-binding EF-hand superfamily protein n=1 Tax=Saccharopolyspora phatthalungensis TaxID=664693 RepID=A0A840QIR6_9PSEU|nr:EF-hand domain-containing protein [Saccharopolyspora phatthalungensis]MBB5158798.1 Ca2+-binding EF-hand superfamily protein [Saccharopolyspora phatthalungensis]